MRNTISNVARCLNKADIEMDKMNAQTPLLHIADVRRCSFFVLIRVSDKYFKTKVYAKSIDESEQIIEKTIIGFEYQIMNIYKANE